jgi:hypothetical protein
MTTQTINSAIMMVIGVGLFFVGRRLSENLGAGRIVKYAGLVVAVCGLLLTAGSFAAGGIVQKMADAINARAPVMVDEGTRLDGATAGPGMLLTYNLTLVMVDGNTIDRDAWINQAVPDIRKNVLGNPDTTKVLKAGISVVMRYSGADGVLVDELKFPAHK